MYFLDLTEETEIIELIEELKTKQVKYPRKGKGVRRKRSNTSKLVSRFHQKIRVQLGVKNICFCSSSIKRTSIHEKSVLSHADTKAEGAALFLQLQNTVSVCRCLMAPRSQGCFNTSSIQCRKTQMPVHLWQMNLHKHVMGKAIVQRKKQTRQVM
jgi:hypothetical protein